MKSHYYALVTAEFCCVMYDCLENWLTAGKKVCYTFLWSATTLKPRYSFVISLLFQPLIKGNLGEKLLFIGNHSLQLSHSILLLQIFRGCHLFSPKNVMFWETVIQVTSQRAFLLWRVRAPRNQQCEAFGQFIY